MSAHYDKGIASSSGESSVKQILVIYHSQEFGNTEACAKLVAEGIRKAGDIAVTMVNTNRTQRVDMEQLAGCDGVALGSPDYGSYVAGTVKQIFDDIYVAKKAGTLVGSKPCVLFMTHGGGGRGADALKQLARNWEILCEPFLCHGAPEESCSEAADLGQALGSAVLSRP